MYNYFLSECVAGLESGKLRQKVLVLAGQRSQFGLQLANFLFEGVVMASQLTVL